MSNLFKSLSVVSGVTSVSRVLGLLRDVLFFSCFGSSAIASAFILAFTLPNLFRRMLGEGTLSSAFIPVYAEQLQGNGLHPAHRILNQVLSRLGLFLLLLSLVVSLTSLYLPTSLNLAGKWLNGAYLNAIIFPYVLLICLSAILVGSLNTHRAFFAGAFSPVILNFCMIGSLILGKWWLDLDGMDLATCLCLGVLAGGLFQLAMPWLQLSKLKGWNWKPDFEGSEPLNQVKALFWVGAFGAAVAQVNVLVSRLLAYSLEDQSAVPYLFLSSRLIELPLGIFAIAISTVLFPEMARSSVSSDEKGFAGHFARGWRLTLALTLPATVGLAMLAEPILSVLFQWGRFGAGDVARASQVLVVASAALPFYALCSYLIKVFHSRRQMKPPLWAGILSLAVNLGLSLLLMERYGVIGLAWANVGAALFQALLLLLQLKPFSLRQYLKPSPFFLHATLLAPGAMAGGLWMLRSVVDFDPTRMGNLFTLCLFIPAGVLIQFVLLFICGLPEARQLGKRLWSTSSK
ncbi:MAG TPA: murein biosynthesis integral membrane protein MurJ [Opitutae bacterium]|nr:murein biosynthesis integral membrane protein MurJ [Opitutae bacterium]